MISFIWSNTHDWGISFNYDKVAKVVTTNSFTTETNDWLALADILLLLDILLIKLQVISSIALHNVLLWTTFRG